MNDGTESRVQGALVKATDDELELRNDVLPQRTDQSISAPVPQMGINHLAMNCVVPGLGSLVRGRKGLGTAQLALAIIGVPMIFSHPLVGLLMVVFAYVWSIATGIGFVQAKGSGLTWR